MSKIKAKKAPVVPSKHRDLVPVGPRDVFSKDLGKRDANGERPTTTRALILRNGKYGARGTGELMAVNRITGREKLDLLAEDLTEKSKKAVASPFRLEQCLKIAESQFNSFLDEIANLQDPDLFYSLIETEYKARTTPAQKAGGADPWKNRSYVASIISTRIHNAYTLASAWQIVLYSLRELKEDGLSDKTVKAQLKKNESFRSRYLVLCDMVNELVDISQAKFSVLATTTPHYARYFKQTDNPHVGPAEVVFDWAGLREACKSFLDSIIIELCFPRAPYPKHILYQILHDAVEESPKEAKRFPQTLWDAVGDLSVTLELQDLLETPLTGPEGDVWKGLPREMPEHYEQWVDARLYSDAASNKYANFKDMVYPLEKTRNWQVLDNMWKYINLNYESVSGMGIDALWELTEARQRTPQWHSHFLPELHKDDLDLSPGLMPSKSKNRKQLLAITNDADDDSDNSMPELQSVSNSSEEDSEDIDNGDSDGDGDEEGENGDDEDGYNAEEEDDMRDMLRAAMDIAVEADFFDSSNMRPELDPFLEDRKSNPFLKLLGSLRGRMFSSSPKLKTTHRAQPRGTRFETVSPLKNVPPEEAKAPAQSAYSGVRPNVETQISQNRKATVEDVEDEDNVSRTTKKKKKKTKKKKKPILPEPEQEPLPATAAVALPTPAKVPEPMLHPPSAIPTSPPQKQATGPKFPVSPVRSPSLNTASSTTLPRMSTASLALPVEPVSAQSARSYLQYEKLDDPKAKIKSRPDHASSFSVPDKKSFFSKFSGKDKTEVGELEKKGIKRNWFTRLGKKTKGYMEQLLGTSKNDIKGMKPMKWEHFLKVMREMGFKYDPSTAGSSVRFDPPDERDPSITFHKPHPDTTIQPTVLKDFSKRLKRRYGWSEEEFLKQTA